MVCFMMRISVIHPHSRSKRTFFIVHFHTIILTTNFQLINKYAIKLWYRNSNSINIVIILYEKDHSKGNILEVF